MELLSWCLSTWPQPLWSLSIAPWNASDDSDPWASEGFVLSRAKEKVFPRWLGTSIWDVITLSARTLLTFEAAVHKPHFKHDCMLETYWCRKQRQCLQRWGKKRSGEWRFHRSAAWMAGVIHKERRGVMFDLWLKQKCHSWGGRF